MAQAQIRLQQANFIQNATRTRYRIISEIQHICETRGTEPSTKLDIEWRKEPHCGTAQITQNSTKFVNNKPISLRMLPVSASLQISKASEKLEEQSQAQNELDTPTHGTNNRMVQIMRKTQPISSNNKPISFCYPWVCYSRDIEKHLWQKEQNQAPS